MNYMMYFLKSYHNILMNFKKYKFNYLDFTKQIGGVNDDINLLYANVGRDYDLDNISLASKISAINKKKLKVRLTDDEKQIGYKPFCDYKSKTNALDNTSQISFDHLSLCLQNLNNIELFTFNEFCYSKLYDLIEFMNLQQSLTNYDVILIAQNRDNKVYPSNIDSLEGYHENISISSDAKVIVDSYYKCTGFIYDRTKIRFNLDLANQYINETIKAEPANQKSNYHFTKITQLLNRNLRPQTRPDIDLGARNLYVITRFDYIIPNKDIISRCLLQYCAFACFTHILSNTDFTLFNPHFINSFYTNSLYNNSWGTQFGCIRSFIEINRITNYIMIGDLNIRYFDMSYKKPMLPTVEDFKKYTQINFDFRKLKTYTCEQTNVCENTGLIVSDNNVEKSNLCTIINLQYSCHKPIQTTITLNKNP
jgi:hypothetical protein